MYLDPVEGELFNRFAGVMLVMQHYGGPTRLLDWTLSPWVAAYFAVNDYPDEDGVVWIVDRRRLVERAGEIWEDQHKAMQRARDFGEWFEAATPEVRAVCQVRSPIDNPRMSSQQSVVTMGGSLFVPQDGS